MLNVVEPVVACRDVPSFGVPGFRTGVRRIHADGHNFWNLQAPLPDDLEATSLPARIGDQIDGNPDAERARILERLEVFIDSDAFAMKYQPFFIDGFYADKHIGEAQCLPEFERLLCC